MRIFSHTDPFLQNRKENREMSRGVEFQFPLPSFLNLSSINVMDRFAISLSHLKITRRRTSRTRRTPWRCDYINNNFQKYQSSSFGFDRPRESDIKIIINKFTSRGFSSIEQRRRRSTIHHHQALLHLLSL